MHFGHKIICEIKVTKIICFLFFLHSRPPPPLQKRLNVPRKICKYFPSLIKRVVHELQENPPFLYLPVHVPCYSPKIGFFVVDYFIDLFFFFFWQQMSCTTYSEKKIEVCSVIHYFHILGFICSLMFGILQQNQMKSVSMLAIYSTIKKVHITSKLDANLHPTTFKRIKVIQCHCSSKLHLPRMFKQQKIVKEPRRLNDGLRMLRSFSI